MEEYDACDKMHFYGKIHFDHTYCSVWNVWLGAWKVRRTGIYGEKP